MPFEISYLADMLFHLDEEACHTHQIEFSIEEEGPFQQSLEQDQFVPRGHKIHGEQRYLCGF